MNTALAVSSVLFELYGSVTKGQDYLLETLCRLFGCQSTSIQENIKTADPFVSHFSFEQDKRSTLNNNELNATNPFILVGALAAFPFKSNNYVNCYLILQFPSQAALQNIYAPKISELLVHIKEALNMAYKITQQETDLKSIHYVLNHYPIPAIAIDDQLNTIFTNQSAQELLKNNKSHLLSHNNNLLKFCQNEHQQLNLKQVLTSSFSQNTFTSKYLAVNINEQIIPIIVATTHSIPNVFRHFSRKKVSWVYLLKPNYSQTLKAHKGFQDLRLSTAETELSILLFEGKNLNDISERRHVSKQTVRKQLQSVLRKTNCDSQESLMIFFFENYIHYHLIKAAPPEQTF